MAAINPGTHASGYDDDRASHERDVLAELRAAGFTDAEQAEFLRAWDATEETLTPRWRFLLDRHWDTASGGG